MHLQSDYYIAFSVHFVLESKDNSELENSITSPTLACCDLCHYIAPDQELLNVLKKHWGIPYIKNIF